MTEGMGKFEGTRYTLLLFLTLSSWYFYAVCIEKSLPVYCLFRRRLKPKKFDSAFKGKLLVIVLLIVLCFIPRIIDFSLQKTT